MEKDVELNVIRLQLFDLRNVFESERVKWNHQEEKEWQAAKMEVQVLRKQLADMTAKMEEKKSEASREVERITAEAEKQTAEVMRRAEIEKARRLAEVEEARVEIAKLR